jgi:Flagellar assembly protein FliH
VGLTLFNAPRPPAQAARPWQANAGLAQRLSSRGFDATTWTDEEAPGFEDLGLPRHATGFASDRYQSITKKLNQQEAASLRLNKPEDEAPEPWVQNPEDAAFAAKAKKPQPVVEELPFVMDVHIPVGQKKAALQAALAAAREMAVQTAQSAEDGAQIEAHTEAHRAAQDLDAQQAEAPVPDASEDASQAAEFSDETANDAQEALTQTDSDEGEGEGEPELPHEVANAHAGDVSADVQAQAEGALAEQIADDSAAAIEATQEELTQFLADTEQAAETAPEPAEEEAPAVVGGIEPDEVLRREAEQFDLGYIKGREDATAAALAQGIEQGEQFAREAMAAEMAAQRELFTNAAQELTALLQDPKKFFEPLKRLAMHLAEQVVMTELTTSTKSIERLVSRCLEELDHPAKGAVVLELNAEDKKRLEEQAADFIHGMRIDAVADLKPGSVRAFANDTVVEDLVETRLTALARAMLVDEEAWAAQSPLVSHVAELKDMQEEDGDVDS